MVDGNNADTTSEKRLVLLNNFVINNKLNLQKSYIFPSNLSNFEAKKIFKDENSGNYAFIGKATALIPSCRLIHFKTQVGEEDVWENWDTSDNNYGWILGDGFTQFDENGNQLIQTLICSLDPNVKKIGLWKKDYAGALTYTEVYGKDYKTIIDEDRYNNQSIFMNENDAYFVLNNQRISDAENHIGLYHINLNNEKVDVIYEKNLGGTGIINSEAIYINKNQNTLFAQYNYDINETSNTATYQLINYQGYFGKEYGSWTGNYLFDDCIFYVSNVYNLTHAYMLSSSLKTLVWHAYNIASIYNPNHNALNVDYTRILNPYHSILYKDNNYLFARNLYNKTINGRTTQSTIQIPNNYLNDTTIDKQVLYSETNWKMVENSNIIQKNIYETLNINFINSIQITNNNDENNPIINNVGASRLNDSISQTFDYENAKMAKIRITFDDGSSYIKKPEYFTPPMPEHQYAELQFYIYTPSDKEITSIQFISNDEITIYQEITNLNLEKNKIYHIFQNFDII